MKVLFVSSLLLVCINAGQDILQFVCYEPWGGPVCKKMHTYYWSMRDKKCMSSKYLSTPCGFFYDKERCNSICTKPSWSLQEAEEFVKNMTK